MFPSWSPDPYRQQSSIPLNTEVNLVLSFFFFPSVGKITATILVSENKNVEGSCCHLSTQVSFLRVRYRDWWSDVQFYNVLSCVPDTSCVAFNSHEDKWWAGHLTDRHNSPFYGEMRGKGLFHISSQGLSNCCLATGLPDCTGETAVVCSPGQVEPHLPSRPATLLDKMWSKILIKMKWMQLFLSRSCVNNCSVSSWEQSSVHLFPGQYLRSWEVSVSLGLGAAAATTRKLIIHRFIWQNSSYLVHCIFVLHGHQH